MTPSLAIKTKGFLSRVTQRVVEQKVAPLKFQSETTGKAKKSLTERIQDRAALIGQTRPAPLILIDALPGKGAQC